MAGDQHEGHVIAIRGAPRESHSPAMSVRTAPPPIVIDMDELLEDGELLGVRIGGLEVRDV